MLSKTNFSKIQTLSAQRTKVQASRMTSQHFLKKMREGDFSEVFLRKVDELAVSNPKELFFNLVNNTGFNIIAYSILYHHTPLLTSLVSTFENHSATYAYIDIAKSLHISAKLLLSEKLEVMKLEDSFKLRVGLIFGLESLVITVFEKSIEENSKNLEHHNVFHLAAIYGHLNILEVLYNLNKRLLISKSQNEKNAFILACENDQIEVVKWLTSIAKGLFENQFQQAFLEACYRDSQKVAQLIFHQSQDKNLFTTQSKEMHKIFLESGAKGSIKIIQWLTTLDKNYLTCINASKQNIFLIACANGHTALATWLLTQDNKFLASTTEHGENAFILACRNGHADTAEWLLKLNKGFLTSQDKQGRTGFLKACYNGHTKIAQWLFLQYDILTNHETSVIKKLFLSRRDLLVTSDDYDVDAFQAAYTGCHVETAQWLLEKYSGFVDKLYGDSELRFIKVRSSNSTCRKQVLFYLLSFGVMFKNNTEYSDLFADLFSIDYMFFLSYKFSNRLFDHSIHPICEQTQKFGQYLASILASTHHVYNLALPSVIINKIVLTNIPEGFHPIFQALAYDNKAYNILINRCANDILIKREELSDMARFHDQGLERLKSTFHKETEAEYRSKLSQVLAGLVLSHDMLYPKQTFLELQQQIFSLLAASNITYLSFSSRKNFASIVEKALATTEITNYRQAIANSWVHVVNDAGCNRGVL